MHNHYLNQENSKSTHVHSILSPLVLVLLSIAFVLSDWLYSYFTFSEYILVIILSFLILTLNFRLTREQLTLVAILFVSLTIHIFTQYHLNETFELRIAIPGMVKLLFYSISVAVIANYIRRYSNQKTFLIINNSVAVIVIIIGMYITYELYRDSRIPQEVFWRFTRRDIYSYYFESNPAIIRTRSIFSEPAHLGFYLNTLIAANLFSQFKSKMLNILTFILSIGVIITFSYSMIGILFIIFLLKGIQLIIDKQFQWTNWYLLVPIVVFMMVVFNWEIVNTTLIQRTLTIVSGQDTSARMRLIDSWQYVSRDNYLIGNGLGHTPTVTNVYAYALSDLGILGIGLILSATGWMIYNNWTIGLVFVLLNSAKGGYLSSSYWFMILILIIYGFEIRKHSVNNNLH